MIYKARVSTKKAQFSHNIMLLLQNNFNKLQDLKTDTFKGLLGSSYNNGIEHVRWSTQYESRETTVQQINSNPWKLE